MKPIVLQKLEPATHGLNYYRLSILEAEQGFTVLHEWGQIGKAPQEHLLPFLNRKAAEQYLAEVCQQKQKNGYDLLLGSDIPLSYTLEHCPDCRLLKQDQGVWLQSSLCIQSPGCCRLIYRDHLSDIFEMDSAALTIYLADIRLVRDALSQNEFKLLFYAGTHLSCELSWQGLETLDIQPALPQLIPIMGQQISWLDL